MKLSPACFFLAALLAAAPLNAAAVDLYLTSFENFTPGADKIAGTDGWTISSRHAAISGLTGIDAESSHLVIGIGNAGWIGGDTDPIVSTAGAITSDRYVFVQKSFAYDPVTADNEIVTIALRAGVKDSTSARRDDFEIYIANTSAQPLAAIQFENSYLVSGVQQRRILRKSTPTTGGNNLQYFATGAQFLYGELHDIIIRINFRTNRWTTWVDGIPIFSDLTFYSGSNARNVGRVGVAMNITNSTNNILLPGENYLLFDDLLVSALPLELPSVGMTRAANGAVTLKWVPEAGYRYQVAHSDGTSGWLTSLPDSMISATASTTTSFTDATAAGVPRRFYRIAQQFP